MPNMFSQSVPQFSEEAQAMLMGLYAEVNTMLGGNNTPLPLEKDDYDTCFRNALRTYRQYSSRSVEFKLYFIELEPNRREYPVPDEVDNVIRIRRSRMGFSGSGLSIDGTGGEAALADATAIDSAILTQILGVGGASGGGDLVGYQMYMDKLETLGKMFAVTAVQFRYQYNPSVGNKILLLDKTTRNEVVMCEVSALRPIEELLSDHFSYNYLFKLVKAYAKIIVGNSIIGSVMPSAQGGLSISWSGWAAEGQEEIANLEIELLQLADSSSTGFAPMIFG